MLRSYIEHIGDHKTLGNKAVWRNFIFPNIQVIEIIQQLVHIVLGKLLGLFGRNDFHKIRIVQNTVSAHYPVGIRYVVKERTLKVQFKTVVKLKYYSTPHNVIELSGDIGDCQIKVLTGILQYLTKSFR